MNQFDRESIELVRRGYGWPHKGECCFLIARDLRSIRAFWNHYPYHQLWNGRSPFRDVVPEATIDDLGELAALPTPRTSAESR